MRQAQAVVGVVVSAALLAPTGLTAQERESDPDRPRVMEKEFRFENGDRLMRVVLERRARLGIKVNLQAGETDSIGALVEAVTPGGPAARAGLQTGDLIIRLDGKSVLAGGAAEDPDRRRSLPGLRLIELAARLEPGDTVPVEFRRGKDRRTVSVVTEDDPGLFAEGLGPRAFSMRVWRPDDLGPVGPMVTADLERLEGPLARREFFSGSVLGRLELAPINPDLGRYFGTEEGVLVISAPEDGDLGLRGGDVVLAVDGRNPTGPGHLLRILRSYERGESFKLDILRNRKREVVSALLGQPPE